MYVCMLCMYVCMYLLPYFMPLFFSDIPDSCNQPIWQTFCIVFVFEGSTFNKISETTYQVLNGTRGCIDRSRIAQSMLS